MSSVGSSRCFRQAPLPPEFLDNEELICALISEQARSRIADEQLGIACSLPHLGDGVVYQVCREVQRRHWEPPVGIEVVGPLPRKYGTL